MVKLLSWNVAGVRAALKRGSLDLLARGEYDVICLQETKALETEVSVPEHLSNVYPHRFWRSCHGEGGQRKGLSGTAIWSKTAPVRFLESPEFDQEGRVTSVEFTDWIAVTVYTPNSQSQGSARHVYRIMEWDPCFRTYVTELQQHKPVVICGDFNVAREDIDVYAPEEYRGVAAGFLDSERQQFDTLLASGWNDSLRVLAPDVVGLYTYWDQKLAFKRRTNRGWRIDYVLMPNQGAIRLHRAGLFPNITGSDHCPVFAEFSTRRRLRITC